MIIPILKNESYHDRLRLLHQTRGFRGQAVSLKIVARNFITRWAITRHV